MAATYTTKYKVKCSNGRIPNSNYSIEYRDAAHSKYRAVRGGCGIGDFKTEREAYNAIVEDTEKYGATGITIS